MANNDVFKIYGKPTSGNFLVFTMKSQQQKGLQFFFRAFCTGDANKDFPSGKTGEPLQRSITKTIENHSILQQSDSSKVFKMVIHFDCNR